MQEIFKNIRKVEPYVPGEQPAVNNVIKLNTNENPYPPSPLVSETLKSFDSDKLRLYPQPDCAELTAALANYHEVDRSQVFVGVGSDDVLAQCFLTFFNSDKPVLFPDISYAFYPVWAELFGIKYKKISLDKDFKISESGYTEPNGGIVFPNPNAPTGILKPLGEVEEILKANPDSVVIVDEAYIDFGGETSLPLIAKYPNLIVTRTFSKSRSLAGMRIGYAIGDSRLIKCLNDVKFSYNSYTMSYPALKLGVASVEDDKYFRESVQKIINTRERSKKELEALGFEYLDSRSNFIFATHKTASAKKLFGELKKAGIFVRYFDAPRIDNYLRITVGTDYEMDRLFEFLKTYLKNEV